MSLRMQSLVYQKRGELEFASYLGLEIFSQLSFCGIQVTLKVQVQRSYRLG